MFYILYFIFYILFSIFYFLFSNKVFIIVPWLLFHDLINSVDTNWQVSYKIEKFKRNK